ncbi:nuclear intron maturase 4, mitochondrial isoform X1 [Prunus avium]|uniref:Nuclear intron maturase 4, mitochondrial isoform X1 n=2 Tax=Prunus avium TaxID=42229 RepID=A0A6P5TRE0_PRUAV|nr:nuclear intron maturase 4, mitochondrial isoform X1 [Prunus avium]
MPLKTLVVAHPDGFAAKRMRKLTQRRAVDYTSTVVRYMQGLMKLKGGPAPSLAIVAAATFSSMSYEKRLAIARKATSLTAHLCDKVQKVLVQSDTHSNSEKSPVAAADFSRASERIQEFADHSTVANADGDINSGIHEMKLAENLANLVEESSHMDERRPKSRMELKRSLELRIKKRVKEQYVNGKFRNLMAKVISNPETLQDAYDCIRLNSNINIAFNDDNTYFDSIAKELCCGSFDVNANTFSISKKGAREEVLVLPNINLRVIQEAIRIVLEVVYKPDFSKISHGYRSGRGHSTALKYISKEISNPDWWFTLLINKKLDACILGKLITVMEDKVEDPSLYAMIQSMFNANVLNLEFGGFPKGHGLPQEGVLSPILMNIYLNQFDHEFYRLSMKYEALSPSLHYDQKPQSKLRSWFRRHLKGNDRGCAGEESFSIRVHSCRFMDEIFFSVAGSKDAALDFKSEVLNYLQKSLHLDVDDRAELLSCQMPHGIHFLGTLVRRNVRESPATRAVHKLKEKVALFGLQKEEAWNAGTVSIGKKWLGHGLKKVKESEIEHLADCRSVLSQISHFRKSGMETDHWYKHLLKIWMEDVKAKAAESEDAILSKYVAEPALPQELRNSFYEFQRQVKTYVSSETTSTLSLLPSAASSTESVIITEIIAPVNAIKKRLLRYGLTTSDGYPRTSSLLILQDNDQIIDWFSGIVRRWLRWYAECDNFNEVKLLISNIVRKSCIRTLAAKYRVHETEIAKRFDTELSRIPSTQEIEQEMVNETSDAQSYDNDEALTYGISYSGLCLLSLARMVSESRPCNCFVNGCMAPAPSVYTLHVMERQKFPGWKTGFSSCIHPSLNRRRLGLCKQHLKDLYLGHISLQSINFGVWK